MLTIVVPAAEYYDESKNEFIKVKSQTLQLEHSLVSLSKWESKWEKPFLSQDEKTIQETLDYARCMTVNSNVDPEVYNRLTESNLREINDYIAAKMTATTVKSKQGPHSNEVITAEIIYYWMISFNIPFECQKWHLNKLLTLINVCSAKNAPEKKMGKKNTLAQNKALNAARRKKYGSKG